MSQRFHPHNGYEPQAHPLEIVYVRQDNAFLKTRVLAVKWCSYNRCLLYRVATGQLAFNDDGQPEVLGQWVAEVYRELPPNRGNLFQISTEIETIL